MSADRADGSEPLPHPADTLGLELEQMRRLGYRMVDLVLDHFQQKAERPAILTGSPADLAGGSGRPAAGAAG